MVERSRCVVLLDDVVVAQYFNVDFVVVFVSLDSLHEYELKEEIMVGNEEVGNDDNDVEKELMWERQELNIDGSVVAVVTVDIGMAVKEVCCSCNCCCCCCINVCL